MDPPLHLVHIKILAADLLSLTVQQTSPPSFLRRGRTVARAELVGIVVSRDRREKFLRFLIDDGTGCVPCILWLNHQYLNANASSGPSNSDPTAEMALNMSEEVHLGTLVRVRGKIAMYRGAIQIAVRDVVLEKDPNAEFFEDMVVSAFHQSGYRCPLLWYLRYIAIVQACPEFDACTEKGMGKGIQEGLQFQLLHTRTLAASPLHKGGSELMGSGRSWQTGGSSPTSSSRRAPSTSSSEIHRRKFSSCSQPPPQLQPLPPHQPYLSLFSPPRQYPSPPACYRVQEEDHGGKDFLSTLSEDNRELRRRNSLLLSELAHMRRLYNDIIYFLQNHVEPVPPPPAAAATGCRLVELGSSDTSPLTTRRPRGDDDEAPVKLFGVRLNDGKKRKAQAAVLLEEKGDGDDQCDGVGDSDGDGDHNGHGDDQGSET
ncbi:hypothetical protein C2845_PM02G25190 [Panicum miliaceum]|uniref:CST complex subunit STN1 n=1 Tax=Panicum miliaceum TaxID=4540 RepID=A0A3L6SGE1_PANMI|nr:hypothetical protein C2845_PM02G25190 [Panicum miliaceum]